MAFPISVVGCPTVPTLSGVSLTGLAAAQARLAFKVTRGSDAPNLKSVTVSLPRGLSFASKHLGKGITVAGPHTLRLSGGSLTISLRKAVQNLLGEDRLRGIGREKAVRQQVRMHKENPTAQLRFAIVDADGGASSLNGSTQRPRAARPATSALAVVWNRFRSP